MSRRTNEELYVPFGKDEPELRGYEKFAAEHGAPPLMSLLKVALVTLGASVAVILILVLTGLRLTTVETPDGDEIRYFGWIHRGAPTAGFMQYQSGLSATVGGGSVRYSDGSVYSGAMKDLLKNGFGKLIFADGSVYEGNFKDGLYDGLGELIYKDGTHYIGAFRAGKYESYENENGEKLGGRLVLSNGTSYQGHFLNGEFSGEGKIVYYDGSSFEGSFKDGMRSHGTYTWTTGEKIEGSFKNNIPDPSEWITYYEGGENARASYAVIRDGVIVYKTPYREEEKTEEPEEEAPEADNEIPDAVG